jgi:glutathione S-transferase
VAAPRLTNLDFVAILYRCKTPTNWLCPCGKVARRLQRDGIEFEEVRVPSLRRDRDEVDELTGQRWVPVLVHEDEVVHDSRRIVEYLDYVRERRAEPAASGEPSQP